MPLLGVNLGKVGFLSKVEADELEAVLGQLVAGDVRDRRADGARGADPSAAAGRSRRTRHFALNDVVVARGALARVCPPGRRDRRVAPRDVRRRRPGRRQPDRLDRLLVLGRRPDPRPDQPQPDRHPDRGLPVGDPLGRGQPAPDRSAAGSSTRTRRSSSIDGREDLPLAVGDVVEVRAVERPIRFVEPAGAAAVLGPAPAQGGAAAVVTVDDSSAGRLLELAVTDLALIDRAAAGRSARASTSSPARPAPARACSSTRSGSRSARGPTPGSSATVPRPPGSRRCSTALPEPLICVREVGRRRPVDRPARRRDGDRGAARREVGPLVEIHGQHDQQRLLDERRQRDLLDAFGGHGRPATRWPARSSAGGRTARRSRSSRSTRASSPAGSSSPSTRPRDRRGRLRPGEADEIRARLGGGPARRGDRPRRRRDPRGAGRRGTAAPGEATAVALREARAELARLGSRASSRSPTPRRARGRARGHRRRGPRRWPRASTTIRPTLAALEERLGAIYALERRYGDDEAAVIAHGERAPPKPSGSRGLEGERAAGEARGRRAAGRRCAAAAGRCPSPGRGRRPSSAAAVGGVLDELGFPAGVFEVALGRRPAGRDEPAVELDGDAVAFDATGADQVVYLLAPEPGRAGPAAGADRVGRRAVARRPGHQGGAGRGRRDADARVRRGRHRHRRPERRPGRPEPVGARRGATRSCA